MSDRMTDTIRCPEDGCDGIITFELHRKGRMDEKGSTCSLDARCDKCSFREDGIQSHMTGIFCFTCHEWRDNTMVCVPCVKKKLGIDSEHDVYPMTRDRKEIQMDCRNTDCKYYESNGDCINPVPAITLNPNGSYVCWSKKEVERRHDYAKWIHKCPAKLCKRPMTVINVYRLIYPSGQTKLQVVYYCFEHDIMLIGNMDDQDLREVKDDGT